MKRLTIFLLLTTISISKKIEESNYILVTPVSFTLDDNEAYFDLEAYNVAAEVLDGIATMAAFAKQNNCTDARATIFVTDLGISSLNTLPRTSTTECLGDGVIDNILK